MNDIGVLLGEGLEEQHCHGQLLGVVKDVTPPVLTMPAAQQIDATSPSGAVATFTATASDAVPLPRASLQAGSD